MTSEEIYMGWFPANLERLRDMVSAVLDYFEETTGGLDTTDRSDLRVVLNELLINSIKHDSAKCIKIIARLSGEARATITIEDDGAGYDTSLLTGLHKTILTCQRVEDIDENGRGIYIVKNLCEEFMVNEKGNRVTVSKTLKEPCSGKIPPPPYAARLRSREIRMLPCVSMRVADEQDIGTQSYRAGYLLWMGYAIRVYLIFIAYGYIGLVPFSAGGRAAWPAPSR